jgi:predicted transposase/invertase (TIGR01784 family)
MRPLFADPKTDFVFKRIFGVDAHKQLLIELLNALLEVKGEKRIVDLTYMTPEQHVPIDELKLSVVDVKCRDASGRLFVVEMQVLNVEGFEKRIVYNAAKAYVMQLRTGEDYPALAEVIAVTICDFEVWPAGTTEKTVPMLSRWRMQEQHCGERGLPQIQHVIFELPKYAAGDAPQHVVDRWAFFFREAENLRIIPSVLAEAPFRDALEVARIASFTDVELEVYDRVKMAEQDARGALSLVESRALAQGEAQGLVKGEAKGLRVAIETLCQVLGIEVDETHRRALETSTVTELEILRQQILEDRRWP